MKNEQQFWTRVSGLYDRFMRQDAAIYDQLSDLIIPVIRGRRVLELATGTGLIARRVGRAAGSMEATDFSPEMIARARQADATGAVRYSVQDACALPYADGSFDIVIIANALHIMPRPELALAEIRRVLRPQGVLIAPTFTHGGMGMGRQMLSRLARRAGFPLTNAWTPVEYLSFLRTNGFAVRKMRLLRSRLPMTYAECVPVSLNAGKEAEKEN